MGRLYSFLYTASNIQTKKLRGIITSGALTMDTGGLISGIPKGLDLHQKLPNELGSGVCSVPEVVDWYGKDPYNRQTFTAGLCYALCAGLEWFSAQKNRILNIRFLMTHGGEKTALST